MGPTGIIGDLVDGVEAVLDNEVIFLEPYASVFPTHEPRVADIAVSFISY